MFKEPRSRRSPTKYLLTILVALLVVALLYVTTTRKSNQIRIELSSKSVSKKHTLQKDNQKIQEIQHLIEQTERLSVDLSEEFSRDLKKMKNFIPATKPMQHKDFIYHSSDKELEKNICKRPYRLLVLCLDSTNRDKRNLYRETWAAERKEILTSDGVMSIDWKMIFVVDVNETFHSKLAFEAEQKQYGDVIGFKGGDNPRREVVKMMTAFEWADTHCDYSFLVKMVDGIFLNTPKMFSFLRDPRVPATELYGGVVEYLKNKTAEFHTNEKSLVKVYPRFIKDAFIMSFDVVSKIISKFHWLRPFAEADAYTGELVLQSGIDVWPIPNFISHDDGGCKEFTLNGIMIKSEKDDCMRVFDKASRKIIPEV